MESYFCHLEEALPALPETGIASRTFLKNEHLKSLLFHFDAGQELSEHTSAHPAIIQILSGTGEVQLGETVQAVHAGAWAYMPPHLPHRISAHTPLQMLLILLEKA